MGIPYGLARVLAWLGVLLLVFAIVDFGSATFFAVDITGVAWSPLVSGGIGALLLRFFAQEED
jgi:hypothetical protein